MLICSQKWTSVLTLSISQANIKNFLTPHWIYPLFDGTLTFTWLLLQFSVRFPDCRVNEHKIQQRIVFVVMWSEQPMSTSMPAVFHLVRPALYSSSGVAVVEPMATDSRLPSSLCLLNALSRWVFSPLAALRFVPPTAAPDKKSKDPTHEAISFLSSPLKVTFKCE